MSVIYSHLDVIRVSDCSPTPYREMIQNHLLKLSPRDRYKRFFSAVSDQSIIKYVEGLSMTRHSRSAVFVMLSDGADEVVGMCHIAVMPEGGAELAVSTDADYRNKGIATALLSVAMNHCTLVGIQEVYVSCLAANSAMVHIADKIGVEAITHVDMDVYMGKASPRQLSVEDECVRFYDLSLKFINEYMWCGKSPS